MIISKTPFRISFFGGGTDFKNYYQKYGGSVIGTTINKYCYITLRKLPPFFKNKYRLVWRKIELVSKPNQIIHPSIKSILNYYKIKDGLEIIHAADLPANSGIGSSSSFTAGLINCIHEMKKKKLGRKQIAIQALNLEQNIMKENVGSQDQVWASYGGFNEITFDSTGFKVKKINISDRKMKKLSNNLIMFFTGKSRFSGKIEKDKISSMEKKINFYHEIKKYTSLSKKIFTNQNKNLNDLGYLLNEYWYIKKKLSKKITDTNIDNIYNEAIDLGALGGKVLGAGGGGFILFYANSNVQKKLIKKFYKLTPVKFDFSNRGSEIIFNNE